MRPALLGLVLLVAASAHAQTPDTLTAADGWRTNLVTSLKGNQTTHSNWQEGGIDALSVTVVTEGTFDRVVGRMLTRQTVLLAYGLLQQDTLDFRKSRDMIRYGISSEVVNKGVIRPTAAFSLRTQFAPGFDYSPKPSEYPSQVILPGEELKVSDLLSPLVLMQSAGVSVRPGGGFVARSGLALKETIVAIERLRPIYGNTPDQPVRTEIGVDAELSLERDLMKNVRLRSRLYTFQGFGMLGQEAPDVLFENGLALTVNDLLNVTIDVATLYDADISEDVQLREALAVGVTFDLL